MTRNDGAVRSHALLRGLGANEWRSDAIGGVTPPGLDAVVRGAIDGSQKQRADHHEVREPRDDLEHCRVRVVPTSPRNTAPDTGVVGQRCRRDVEGVRLEDREPPGLLELVDRVREQPGCDTIRTAPVTRKKVRRLRRMPPR